MLAQAVHGQRGVGLLVCSVVLTAFVVCFSVPAYPTFCSIQKLVHGAFCVVIKKIMGTSGKIISSK